MSIQRFTPPPPSRDTEQPAVRLVVVSGLSGSGKTVALRTLEDLDYYCVDNLPVALMPAFVESVTTQQAGRYPRLAVGVDVRNRVGGPRAAAGDPRPHRPRPASPTS